MYAPPCSWRTGTNWIDESARDSFRSRVSSPGIPNTYRTPSASRHSTKTSEALRSPMSAPYLTEPTQSLTATRRLRACLGMRMRAVAAGMTVVMAALVLVGPASAAPARPAASAARAGHAAPAAPPGHAASARHAAPSRAHHVARTARLASVASAASTLFIRGGGYGHGIGMSQYGTYGYALHGWSYRQILAHYYTGTQIGTTNPNQTVRVLLGSGSAAFAGATRAGGKQLNPSLTYDVVPLANGQLALVNQSTHKQVGKFDAPLTATGPGPLSLAGLGAYRGALEFRPNGSGGVYTVDVVGLDDYVRGVISAEMPAS